jgi:hypothetical protein
VPDAWAGSHAIVAYPGAFCSLLAFFLYAYRLTGLDAGSAVGLRNLVPVFEGFGHDPARGARGPARILGGLGVAGGVMLGLRSPGADGATGESHDDSAAPRARGLGLARRHRDERKAVDSNNRPIEGS